MRLGVVCTALLLVSCGQTRVIGRSCEQPECAMDAYTPRSANPCGVQFDLPPSVVEPDVTLERCHLFTLDGLEAPEGDERVFLTRVETSLTPFGHDLDLRLAPEIEEFGDGPIDCAELRKRAVPWLPLMTTQHDRDSWDFSNAPLAAARRHRLLLNDSYTNLTAHAVEASARITVECASSLPARVSQSFEFSSRDRRVVNPGERVVVSAPCAFSKPVSVTRLHRRTRLITGYAVRRLHDTQPLWESDADWILDLDSPLTFAADDGFRWECTYENRTDVSFTIGGNSSDECVLLGIYQLPDGSLDPFPERCSR